MKLICFLLPVFLSTTVWAAKGHWRSSFVDIYSRELSQAEPCMDNTESLFRLCSHVLRNNKTGPFMLHHGRISDDWVVLFHGLGDSPFYLSSIAEALHRQGHTVLVALLPGHGKKRADADMQDPLLSQRWISHVHELVSYVQRYSRDFYLGGFSTGGALAVHYALHNPDKVAGLLLFSGALALNSSVEFAARIPGIKSLAKILDGDYQSEGPNPYKYPRLSKFGAFMLMDVIIAIRQQLAEGEGLALPLFVAHSMADRITPWQGVQSLMDHNKGPNSAFVIGRDRDLCHSDLVISEEQDKRMQFDHTQLQDPGPCSIPRANAQHTHMLAAMKDFLLRHKRPDDYRPYLRGKK